MAYFRQLGVIGVLGACFFVAAGCGDEDDKTNDGDAGEGGESAGKGGKSQAGSNSNAGKGGKSTAGSAGSGTAGSGTAGSAGNAGTPNQGGEAGEGGSGGSAGEPPIGGGEGGGGTSTGGDASGGDGGAGAAPTLTFCANSCAIDDDCAIGEDKSTTCDPTTHRCVPPGDACETDDTCLVAANFLWSPCGDENACDEGLVCVEVGGEGYCAPLGPDCFPTTLTLPVMGGQGATADVCGMPGRCGSNKRCFMSCIASGCGEDGATCDAESGLCSCTAPGQCAALPYANAPDVCE